MPWIPPFLDDFRDVGDRADLRIHGTDDEIMGLHVGQLGRFVRGESRVLLMPSVVQFAHRSRDELRQIAFDVNGMLASQLDFPGEGEVVADENRSDNN